eukprot:m51a1_g3787 hypothetical protein (344) ;mRNA; f:175506-176605
MAHLSPMHMEVLAERRRLEASRAEYTAVSDLLGSLPARPRVMVPLGSSAFVPGELVIAYLGEDVFASCSTAKAREIAALRVATLDKSIAALDESLRRIEAEMTGLGDRQGAFEAMRSEGIQHIREELAGAAQPSRGYAPLWRGDGDGSGATPMAVDDDGDDEEEVPIVEWLAAAEAKWEAEAAARGDDADPDELAAEGERVAERAMRAWNERHEELELRRKQRAKDAAKKAAKPEAPAAPAAPAPVSAAAAAARSKAEAEKRAFQPRVVERAVERGVKVGEVVERPNTLVLPPAPPQRLPVLERRPEDEEQRDYMCVEQPTSGNVANIPKIKPSRFAQEHRKK